MKKIEKSLTTPKKNLKGEPLVVFNIHSVGKYQKKIEGGSFGEIFFRKKISQSRKYSTGVPFGSVEFLR